MIITELIDSKIIMGERNYEAAINLVVTAAQHELVIFDQDFTKGGFASREKFELLQRFLSKKMTNKLTIILQNTHFFSNNCPRLQSLLSTYGHMMTVFETNDTAKIAKECFVVADKKHYCHRFHIDQARFKYALDAQNNESVAGLLMRYDAIFTETTAVFSATKLGL